MLKTTREALLETARQYDDLAARALTINTHDRPFYLRQAALHRAEAAKLASFNADHDLCPVAVTT